MTFFLKLPPFLLIPSKFPWISRIKQVPLKTELFSNFFSLYFLKGSNAWEKKQEPSPIVTPQTRDIFKETRMKISCCKSHTKGDTEEKISKKCATTSFPKQVHRLFLTLVALKCLFCMGTEMVKRDFLLKNAPWCQNSSHTAFYRFWIF